MHDAENDKNTQPPAASEASADAAQAPAPAPVPAPADELFETDIEKLVTGGAGLGRCRDLAAFVPLTAPGDRVHARVLRRKKSFVQAELTEVLQPGPGRVDPVCPHYGSCGGCDLQHLGDEAQREAKAAIVRDCFSRLGKMDVSDVLRGPDPVENPLGYRNRIRLTRSPAGPFGLMRRGSNEVVPLETCPQLPPLFDRTILPFLREMPPVDQIVVRLDGAGGFLLSLFGPPNRVRPLKTMLKGLKDGAPPCEGCIGLLYNNLPLWGRDHLLMKVAGHTFRVHANSFFQANLEVAQKVLATAREWLGAGPSAAAGSASGAPMSTGPAAGAALADLYCGAGLFTLGLADLFERSIGVESDAHSVRDAQNNVARDSAAKNKAVIWRGRVEKALEKWPEGAPEPARDFPWSEATVVLDPPRTGLGRDAAARLRDMKPRRVLYLSCDPATMARDCAVLTAGGYSLDALQAFDMFPQTGHVEVLGVLGRK